MLAGLEDGETISEPLITTATDYSAYCAIHGRHDDAREVHQYHSLMRSPQLSISLGRIDAIPIVMKVSSFTDIARRRCLEHAIQAINYLHRFKLVKVRYRTHDPNLPNLLVPEFNGTLAMYNSVMETPQQTH